MSPAEVVVDASLAVKWVVDEPYSSEARALLDRWGDDGRRLLAPALFLYEVTNVLAKRIQRRQLTLEQAKERLRFFQESGPLLQQIASVHPRSLELMERFGLPTAYDAHYLAWPSISAANAGPPTSGSGTLLNGRFRGCAGSEKERLNNPGDPALDEARRTLASVVRRWRPAGLRFSSTPAANAKRRRAFARPETPV